MSLWPFLKPYRSSIILVVLCLFLANLAALVFPWGVKVVIDQVLPQGDKELLAVVSFCLLGVVIVRACVSFFEKYFSNILGEKIAGNIRRAVYEKAQKLSLVRLRSLEASQVFVRITSDVDSIRRFLFGDALEVVYALFSLVAVLLILSFINLRLAGLALVFMPAFAIVYARLLPRLKDGYYELRENYSRQSSRINEALGGMTTVKVFRGGEYELGRFDVLQQGILRAALKSHGLNCGLWTLVELFTGLGVLAVLYFGGMDLIAGRMTIGSMVAFYSYLGMLFGPIIRVVVTGNAWQEALASWRRLEEVLQIEVEPELHPVKALCPSIRNSVSFKNVSFQYVSGKPVLTGINLTVQSGETVAVIGPSGSGKSTLAQLLLRLLCCDRGMILVGGVDIRLKDIKEYRRRVSAVLQDDFLFADTVARNIAYGQTEFDMDRVIEAARMSAAHEFIAELSNGYETNIGERGCRLSCGQRQRIALARAIMSDPEILILDEATSAVDTVTENRIQAAVKEKFRGRTVFIVAHRLSSTMHADRTAVLEGGRVTAFGTHSELLNRSPFYRQLYQEQFKPVTESRSSASSIFS